MELPLIAYGTDTDKNKTLTLTPTERQVADLLYPVKHVLDTGD